ncbi:unnamed protein product [Ilex paraguariensis]|uniref:GRAM domain-containing protein n=1 Tax=Ilex paraguariensis TaxID=185542 RepID=A0ABC8RWC7_9AQUA
MSQNPKPSDHSQPDKPEAHVGDASHSSDYAPYPKLDPKDVAPPTPPAAEIWTSVPVGPEPPAPPPAGHTSVHSPRSPTANSPRSPTANSPRSPSASEGPPPISENSATTMPQESNPYVSSAPMPQSSMKNRMDTVKDVLGKWGKKAAEATKKAEGFAGDMWQHLKTGPSFADAAVGRIAQGTKVLAEGGYEKIFRQTFETVPEEQLLKAYACYLSASSGPVMGILYLSTAKLAFYSDNPLSYKVGEQTEWSYYKVHLFQLCILLSFPWLAHIQIFRDIHASSSVSSL